MTSTSQTPVIESTTLVQSSSTVSSVSTKSTEKIVPVSESGDKNATTALAGVATEGSSGASTSTASSSSTSTVEKVENPKKFTDVFDEFFIFAEKILAYVPSNDILGTAVGRMNGESNSVQVALRGYKRVYNDCDETRNHEMHVQKMKEIYDKCRPFLLATKKSDETSVSSFITWLNKKSALTMSLKEKSKNKILFSAIARKCCSIADAIEENADEAEKAGDMALAQQYLDDPVSLFPEKFILHLLRLFYFCADETDKRVIIAPKIKEMESMLGLSEDQTPSHGGANEGLNGLISMATKAAKAMGVKDIPDNIDINSKQFTDVLNTLTKSGALEGTLKNVFAGINMNDMSGIPAAISQVVNRMKETGVAVPEGVQKANAVALPEGPKRIG